MKPMNKKYGFFATAAACVALLLGSCTKSNGLIGPGDVQNTPAINATLITPETKESGSIKAYIGTEVTAPGFNLDRVSGVMFDEQTAQITEQTIKVLKFKVPALGYPQRDLPYAVRLKVLDQAGEAIFSYNYFVTIPVTDAVITGYTPTSGTVGTEITLAGRNLEQITRVHIGQQTVEALAFTSHTAAEVKFLVPAGSYQSGDTQLNISAEWGENTIDVTGDEPFVLHIPAFDALAPQPAGQNSKLGDEISLTGENLGYVDSVRWDTYRLTVVEQSATAITLRFPASIKKADPLVQTKAINAYYGKPATAIQLSEAWRVDTTPVGPAKPVATSITVEDGGDDPANLRYYLTKTVTVAGENLSSVEKIVVRYTNSEGKVEDVQATIAAGGTDSELQFAVPDGVSFDQATDTKIVAIYNGADESELGAAKVYPFYFYKDVVIGGQDPENASMAFFVPDQGKVLTTAQWAAMDTASEAYIMSGPLTINKEKLSETAYNAVPAYFFSAFTGGVYTLQSPANSTGQLKNFKVESKSITGGNWYGTPVLCYKLMSGTIETEVKEGVIATLVPTQIASTAAPKFGTDFNEGSVLLVEYFSYAVTAKPSSSTPLTDIAKCGYIHVKSVRESSSAKGNMTFDFYWSKRFNE